MGSCDTTRERMEELMRAVRAAWPINPTTPDWALNRLRASIEALKADPRWKKPSGNG